MAQRNELTIVAKLRDLASRGFKRLGNVAGRTLLGIGRMARRLDKLFTGLILRVGALAIAMAGFLGIAAFKKLSEDIDRLAKSARRLGIATEELSALNHAAELSGVSAEKLAKGITTLQKRSAEAADGNKLYALSLARLGIDYGALASGAITTTEALGQMADGMAAQESQTMRTRLAFDAMGRSGTELLTMLQGGSKELNKMTDEAHRLGITVSESTGRKFEAFNDSVLRFSRSIRGIILGISDKILPLMSDGLDRLAEQIAANQKDIIDSFIQWGIDLAKTMIPLAKVFETFGRVAGAKLLVLVTGIQGAQFALDALNAALVTFTGNTFEVANAQLKAAESADSYRLTFAALKDMIGGIATSDPGALLHSLVVELEDLRRASDNLVGADGEGGNLAKGLENAGKAAEKVKSPFADIAQLVGGIGAGLQNLADEFGNTFELGRQVATSAGRAITDELGAAFEGILTGTKSASEAFADFGRGVLKIMAQVISKIIATKVALAALGIFGISPAGVPGLGVKSASTGAAGTGIQSLGGARANAASFGGSGGGGGAQVQGGINVTIVANDTAGFDALLTKRKRLLEDIFINALHNRRDAIVEVRG